MRVTLRGWLVLGALAVVPLGLAASSAGRLSAQDSEARSGQLTEASLGNLLDAMGLEPKKEEQRYDFSFKALYQGEEWDLTMSAVLSRNGESVWVMAWMDELPRSAADVPRTALLRLLADNDRLGKGKFFAYIASNRRFVMQRVVENRDMSTAAFRDVLKDLGASVVETYPHWSVANWTAKKSETESDSEGAPTGGEAKSAPSQPRASGRSAAIPSKSTKR